MILKIFIVGEDYIDKCAIAKEICSIDDDLSISPKFTNDEDINKLTNYNEYTYYMNNIDIDLSYKNNAFLYIYNEDEKSCGVTLDDFYNNDIFCLNTEEFNFISDNILFSYSSLIIWVDTKRKRNKNNCDQYELNHFLERTENLPRMYFLDESPKAIAETIIRYLNSSIEDKEKILEENS